MDSQGRYWPADNWDGTCARCGGELMSCACIRALIVPGQPLPAPAVSAVDPSRGGHLRLVRDTV